MKGRSALPRTAFVLGLLIVGGGAAASVWGRQLLTRVSFFNVRQVEVIGTRLMAPDSVIRLAAITTERSIWEDFAPIERRLATHALIDEARVHWNGSRGLRIVVREVEPVAFVGIPDLRVVRADGTVLPIDPARVSLDLPVLIAPAEIARNSLTLTEGPARRALAIFAELRELDPGLAAIVSDFGLAEPQGGGLVANLAPSQPALRLALPPEIDELVVRRVRATLADLGSRGVDAAEVEARYADQVVVRVGELQASGGSQR